jgi:hypothetical protein
MFFFPAKKDQDVCWEVVKRPDRVFLWYRLVKYRENTDRYQTEILNRDATLEKTKSNNEHRTFGHPPHLPPPSPAAAMATATTTTIAMTIGLLPSPLASCLRLLLSHCRRCPGLPPSSWGDTG